MLARDNLLTAAEMRITPLSHGTREVAGRALLPAALWYTHQNDWNRWAGSHGLRSHYKVFVCLFVFFGKI